MKHFVMPDFLRDKMIKDFKERNWDFQVDQKTGTIIQTQMSPSVVYSAGYLIGFYEAQKKYCYDFPEE